MKTALELPKEPRHPDGVVLDPDPGMPVVVEHAQARGVVSLKEPVGDEVIRRGVDAFFDAFTRHDPDALDAILSRSARLLDAHGGSTYSALREELRGRIRAFEAAAVTSLHVEGVDRFDYRDLGGVAAARKPPQEMRPGDVLVRVHVAVPRSGSTKLFAPVVVLLLRWEDEADAPGKTTLRVAGYDEAEEDLPGRASR